MSWLSIILALTTIFLVSAIHQLKRIKGIPPFYKGGGGGGIGPF